jgi:hypothetical protein
MENYKSLQVDYARVLDGGSKMMYLSNYRLALLAMVFILLGSSAIAQDSSAHTFGSKVKLSDSDESKALSRFFVDPEFAFYDANIKGIFDSGDPVYIHINPTEPTVSENDVRLTSFGSFPPGSQVRLTDPDVGYPLSQFGSTGFSRAEVRYFDVDGDKAYSLNDPVYLDFNPGTVTSGDIRLTNYMGYDAGTRVRDSDLDSGKPTTILPGMLNFFNSNGDINNGGYAIYDSGDIIYMDTQAPFLTVTVNDIRLSS